jgi:hypothetical protein
LIYNNINQAKENYKTIMDPYQIQNHKNSKSNNKYTKHQIIKIKNNRISIKTNPKTYSNLIKIIKYLRLYFKIRVIILLVNIYPLIYRQILILD